MPLVVAHLSDIHIAATSDLILGRARDVATAIVAASGGDTECLIFCTGDITYSGTKAQYALAFDFFRSVNAELVRCDRRPIFVFCPGNHDCDFANDDRIRAMLLDGIRKEPHQAREPDVQAHCLKVQDNFHAFVSECRNTFPTHSTVSTTLFTRVDEGRTTIQIVNSAWMSSIHEAPGSLVFPESLIDGALDKFTITCLHHPPQWFSPIVRRELWRTVAQSSDLVLTGHEHEPEQSTLESRTDQSLHSRFEAGALQHKGSDASSSFSVYVLDVEARMSQNYMYDWDESEKHYKWRGARPDRPRPLDEPLPLNKFRSVKHFEFNAQFKDSLCRLTMNITHPIVGDLRLNDLFVYPDIACVRINGDTTTVRGEEVLRAVEDTPFSLITGDKYSGKTSLARMLALDLNERGFVPVTLRTTKKLRNSRAWIEAAEKAFCEQYSDSLLTQFQQLAPSNRVLIVDDADLSIANTEGYAPHLLELPKYAARVVLLSETVAINPKLLVRLTQTGVPHYQIRPFGYRQRDVLVQKWLLLGGGQLDGAAIVRKLHEATKNINSIIGKGLVPSFPFFVLALLHAADSVVQLESRTSAHGYYFEQLIRTELLRGKQEHAKLDVTLGVLSFIAYRFFTADKDRMSDRDLRDIVAHYEKKYALALDYMPLLNHLIERRMIHSDGHEYRFSYDYIYYFFVARYLSRNLDDHEVKKSVAMLCRATERKKYGDILLFLAHFSNDPFVIAEMVAGATAAFDGKAEIDLRKDLTLLRDFSATVDEFVFQDGDDTLGARDVVLAQRDAEGVTSELDLDENAEVNRLLAALRNMEVVGQVLKNNPGHLDGTRKLEIASAAYGVGARIWRWFLHLIADGQRELVEHLMKEARGENPAFSTEQLRENVNDALLGLVRLGSLGMVKRIALSIGSPELEPTYRDLVNAVQGDAPQLVHMSIRLDCMPGSQTGELGQTFRDVAKNPLAVWILKQLVYEHLHLFHFEAAEKQALCAAVDIEYKSGLGTNQRPKLLPKPTRG